MHVRERQWRKVEPRRALGLELIIHSRDVTLYVRKPMALNSRTNIGARVSIALHLQISSWHSMEISLTHVRSQVRR